MSTRLSLLVKQLPDIDLLEYGFYLTRLLCHVQFPTRGGYTRAYPALVDTGAPVSVIPKTMWVQTAVRKLTSLRFRGAVAREECAVAVEAGIITGRLCDQEGHAIERPFRAYLAETDEVPLLLGFQDLLDHARLFVDAAHAEAWLEFV